MKYPVSNVGGYIANLAKQRGVTYKWSLYDDLAEVITCLSGDEAEMDENELLLFALQRAGVITTRDVIALQLNYLREKMNANKPSVGSHRSYKVRRTNAELLIALGNADRGRLRKRNLKYVKPSRMPESTDTA